MKKARNKACVLLVIVLSIVLIGCGARAERIDALRDYRQVVEGDIPEDFRMTIYYMDPNILTRMPLSVEDLIAFPETKMITVEHGELAAKSELLKELKSSILSLVEEPFYMNARLYYVFERGEETILEVVISEIHGSVIVNGYEMEDHTIFYELIEPFLTEEAHETLGF